MIKISLADDHKIFAELTAEMLAEKYEVVDIFYDGEEVLKSNNLSRVDILILDLWLPKFSGLEIVDRVLQEHQKLKILVLTSNTNPEVLIELYKRGVHAYIPKARSKNELLKALDIIEKGEKYFSDLSISDLLYTKEVEEKEDLKLTKREREIIKLILKKMTNEEIAKQLFISKSTVKTHRQNIYYKLNVSSLDEIYKIALIKKLF